MSGLLAADERRVTAPATDHPGHLRHLQLNLKLLESGAVQVSTPQARDFAVPARGPDQLWRAMQAAFVEARRAGHAAWCGGSTDRADDELPVIPVATSREGVSWSKSAAARPDVAPAEDWLPLADGSWVSPGGKRYRSARIIAAIVARRAALGLPASYEAAVEHYTRVAQAAAEAGDAQVFWERQAAVDPESRWHTSDKRNPGRVAS